MLGINLGLSSVEVAAIDLMGLVTARASAEFPVISLRPRWVEAGPHAWIDAAAAAVRQCLNEAGHSLRPIALGISGVHGVVLADGRGEPVRPAILGPDMRAPGCTRRPPRTGAGSGSGMTGPTLEWLARHEPGNWARTRWALAPKDWLRAHLTEEFGTEPSDASRTLLYDLAAGSWSSPLLSALDITPAVLPALPPVLAHSRDRSGHITKRGAELFGLPARIPVAAGAADTAAAALASGLVEPGPAKLIIADGAQFITPVGESRLTATGSAPDAPVYRAATDQGWYTMTEVSGAGRTLDWVQRVLGASWLELHACAAIEPKADDPVFVPHLNGERAAGGNAGGGAGSWSGIREHHDRQDLLRSAMEGVAFAITNAAARAPSHTDWPLSLRVSGRAGVGENWQQMLADVLDCPLEVSNGPDGPEVGAALLGSATAEITGQTGLMAQLDTSSRRAAEPNRRFRDLYRQRHETFNRIIASLTARSEPGHSSWTPHPSTV